MGAASHERFRTHAQAVPESVSEGEAKLEEVAEGRAIDLRQVSPQVPEGVETPWGAPRRNPMVGGAAR